MASEAAAQSKDHHLLHSHAHEEDIPGTVNLKAAEGDDVAYGQALFPVPAEDPNDPLQWSNFKKTMILIICSFYSFLANSSLIGPSPYIDLWAEEFGISTTKASELVSYPNLAFGFGSLIFVPMYLKYGRRPVMLFSLVSFAAGLIGASRCTTYGGLLAARIVHGFGSCVCEALPVQLVNDIFFLHERGKRIGYYTVCLCLGTFGSLPAGYMLAGGYGWRLFFYVEFAFAMALLILAFFFVEETSYNRKAFTYPSTPPNDTEKEGVSEIEKGSQHADLVVPPRKSLLQTLSLWGRVDNDVPFFKTMIRSFTYFLVPQSLWVITTFGINIGLSALAFSYTFPILIVSPPYNWAVTNSGLFAIAAVVGYGLAVPFTSSSDRLAAYFTKRNNGIREAEMRLGVMLPAMLIGPAGIVLYGLTAERGLHWICFFVGGAMNYWAAYFYFSFTLAYAVDSYYANTSEMLIAMNIGKQAISFGLGLKVLAWVLESGYAVVISGAFGGVLLLNNLFLLFFMIWGKKLRKYLSETWLARLHFRSIREVTTH
ncbi:putative MFS transporter [Annulohypoxylon truncatum]|uniref:putative MFS transporter n=1 Tax=Annulohypoxylon truncatum TaxID=327061 RepID=UPI002007CEB8|nr:putative MFS transporter [Annulohypoxylon truncatum]KAI1206137.1 putative MFS transporter [Annulohypoxylon truncatum]